MGSFKHRLKGGPFQAAINIKREGLTVKKVLYAALVVLVFAGLVMTAACAKGGSDPLVGTWGMKADPSKTVKITKEGGKYFYEGSQGKTEAQKQDENTLLIPMGPIQVTAKLDPAAGVLSVSFMGENYQYTKTK